MPEETPDPVTPHGSLPTTWINKKHVRVGVTIGLVILLLYVWFKPAKQSGQLASPEAQAQSPVSQRQIQDFGTQLAATQQDVKDKQSALDKQKAALAAIEGGLDIGGLDLTTPAGQAAFQNRLLAALAKQQQPPRATGGSGNAGGGESKAEKERKELMTPSIVFDHSQQQQAKSEDNGAESLLEKFKTQADASASASAPKREGEEEAESPRHDTDKRNKSLLDLNESIAKYILPEDFVVEGVLTNKLVGDAAGPVKVMLTTSVYAPGTHELLFPMGTVFSGEAVSVTAFGESRLGVFFHRVIVHDGARMYSVSLDQKMPGLDQQGAVGLKDKVNQHILSSIAIAGVVGAIGGLGQIGNTGISSGGYSPMSQFQSGISQSMSQSSMQILNRFLNRRPTVEIRPGTRVKLIMAYDLKVPSFTDGMAAAYDGSAL